MTFPLHELGADNPMDLLPINQRDLERVLDERAAELGVDVRRGYEVRSFAQFDDHVEVPASREDGGEAAFGAGFLVGVALLDPEHPLVHTVEWEDEPAGAFPGSGVPMTLAEMEASVERILGAPVSLTPPPDGAPTLLRRLCGRNTRVAGRYRNRRVLLAGDAANVHAAAGGPGLNLARRDNLQLVADLIAGADVRYATGEEDPAAPTGWFAPSLAVQTQDGQQVRLAELLRYASPVLLDLTEGGELNMAATASSDRVTAIAGRAENAPAPALLILPDATSRGPAQTRTACGTHSSAGSVPPEVLHERGRSQNELRPQAWGRARDRRHATWH
jgi:hypothetical protein